MTNDPEGWGSAPQAAEELVPAETVVAGDGKATQHAECVLRAGRLLRGYARVLGATRETASELLIGLFADLMHYAWAEDIDLEACLDEAARDYEAEELPMPENLRLYDGDGQMANDE
jgi:hypothetical protein